MKNDEKDEKFTNELAVVRILLILTQYTRNILFPIFCGKYLSISDDNLK